VEHKLGTLKPNEALIYERVDGVVYAHYRDDPSVPRWIIGGDPGAISRAQGKLLHYGDWQELCDLCEENETLKKQMDKLVTIYWLIKDSK